MFSFLSLLIRSNGALLNRRFEHSTRCPSRVQRQLLLRVLSTNKNTIYGRHFSFSTIADEGEFRKAVPIVEYIDIEPYVEKIKAGGSNILTSEPIEMFARTSGTTARPKYIPVTASGGQRSKQLMRLWLYRSLLDHPLIFDGKLLAISGSMIEGYVNGNIAFGSASGLLRTALPAHAQSHFAVPECIAEIEDYELRYYLLARLALAKQVTLVIAANPLTLVKLAETAQRHQEEIIRSIHNGWLADKLRTNESCRKANLPLLLHPLTPPDKERARFLTGVLEKTGKLSAADCWPKLSLIGCWLGGSIGFQAPLLEPFYGTIPKRDVGYMASEGSFTLPIDDATPAGVLAVQNNYYEFILEDQMDKSSPDILTVSDVVPGNCYKLLLTNENGLYRYDINDIVKVEARWHEAPIISFVRKCGNILNITGEKLHVSHLLYAINKLQSHYSLLVQQFRAVADPKSFRYELFLEIRSPVNQEFVREELLPALDGFLCECNIEYSSRRRSQRLNAPRIHAMKPNWEENIRKVDIAGGKRDLQYKWLQMCLQPRKEDYEYVLFTVE